MKAESLPFWGRSDHGFVGGEKALLICVGLAVIMGAGALVSGGGGAASEDARRALATQNGLSGPLGGDANGLPGQLGAVRAESRPAAADPLSVVLPLALSARGFLSGQEYAEIPLGELFKSPYHQVDESIQQASRDHHAWYQRDLQELRALLERGRLGSQRPLTEADVKRARDLMTEMNGIQEDLWNMTATHLNREIKAAQAQLITTKQRLDALVTQERQLAELNREMDELVAVAIAAKNLNDLAGLISLVHGLSQGPAEATQAIVEHVASKGTDALVERIGGDDVQAAINNFEENLRAFKEAQFSKQVQLKGLKGGYDSINQLNAEITASMNNLALLHRRLSDLEARRARAKDRANEFNTRVRRGG